jgi:N-acetylneuraminic acid mutarotase
VIQKRFVFAGGSYWRDDQKFQSDRTDYFDPETNTWSAGPALPEVRSDAACATLHDAVYVFGGVIKQQLSNVVLRLDTSGWRNLEEAHLPEPRMYSVAAVIGDSVYLFGGLRTTGDLSSASKTLWVWRPGSEWKTLAEFPGSARVSSAVAALNGKLYVFGGLHSSPAGLQNLDEAWTFDPNTNSWAELPKLPVARRAWSAVAKDGQILILGGYTNTFSDEIYAFNPGTRKSSLYGTLPHPLADAKYAIIGSRLVTAGGESGVKIRAPWTLQGDPAK